jgi:hypothetical protein
MSADAGQELDRRLADIAQAIEDAKTFMNAHELTSTATRKLPSALLPTLERWRERTREATPHADLH